MSTSGEAMAAVSAAAAVTGVRAHELGEEVSPPGVVVGPPRLDWAGACSGGEPSQATMAVFVIESLDDHALERLLDLVPLVVAAIEADTPAVVTGGSPATYFSGAGELPAYELTVEFPL